MTPCKCAKAKTDDSGVHFIAILCSPFVYAWLLMLGMGAAHSALAVVPAVAYWTAMGIFYGLVAVKFALFHKPGNS